MAESIRIQVNGESKAWRPGGTVGELLRELDIRADRVAVELNLEILDRDQFDQRSLAQGDRLEILSFIGGGTPPEQGYKGYRGDDHERRSFDHRRPSVQIAAVGRDRQI